MSSFSYVLLPKTPKPHLKIWQIYYFINLKNGKTSLSY